MQVGANVPSGNFGESALIENLIIDGGNNVGTVGILLQNVYNCCIRNITIKNCEVGIKIENTSSYWSHANRLEHIRMINVKTGILFNGTSTGKDFSFTTIDDVGMSLKDNDSDAVGIKVGSPYGNIYNGFIKATVWLGSSNGTGMTVNGEVKLSLVNLEVEEPALEGGGLRDGVGVKIVTQDSFVSENQNFLLTTGGIKTPPFDLLVNNTVVNTSGNPHDINVRSFV
jgi:hypothetical protein